MTADPVKEWVLYWYEKLQIEAWARVKKPRPKSVPSGTTLENQRRTKCALLALSTFAITRQFVRN
jgi:hypothetical protein